jgi:hypothetical protein
MILTAAVMSTVCGPDQCCPNFPAWCILMYTQSPEFSLCPRLSPAPHVLLSPGDIHTATHGAFPDNIDCPFIAKSLICDI